MSDNMNVWDKMKTPPADRLKTIAGGALKGMSDINPQWRYEIMTEVFGQCGIGWWYTIDELWERIGANDEVMCFARVTVYTSENGITSQGIPSVGGSRLINYNKNGLQNNDEAYKMAITDALGTALKMLGVAADIYAGKWDGSKYKDEPDYKPTPTNEVQSSQKKIDSPLISAEYFKQNISPIAEILQRNKPDGVTAYNTLLTKYGITRAGELKVAKSEEFVRELKEIAKPYMEK